MVNSKQPSAIFMIGLLIVAGMAVIGWGSPVSKFTQSVADSLYCSLVLASGDCVSHGQYDVHAHGWGSNCENYLNVVKTTTTTITSTSFATIVSGTTTTVGCTGPIAANDVLVCISSFYFSVNASSVGASFGLKDTSTGGLSFTWLSTGATVNTIGSVSSIFSAAAGPNTVALQGAVSGANMQLQVFKVGLQCLDANVRINGLTDGPQ